MEICRRFHSVGEIHWEQFTVTVVLSTIRGSGTLESCCEMKQVVSWRFATVV